MHDIRTYVMQNLFSRLWQCLGCVYTGPTPILASGPAADAWAVESGAPGRRECVRLLHQRLQTLVQCRRTRVEVPRVGTDSSGQFGPLSDRQTHVPASDYGTFICCDGCLWQLKGWLIKISLRGSNSPVATPSVLEDHLKSPSSGSPISRNHASWHRQMEEGRALTFVVLMFTIGEGQIRALQLYQ